MSEQDQKTAERIYDQELGDWREWQHGIHLSIRSKLVAIIAKALAQARAEGRREGQK